MHKDLLKHTVGWVQFQSSTEMKDKIDVLNLLLRKKVCIIEGGINNCLKKGSFAICCIDIDPV